jgi:hypothetical protein
MRLRCNDRGVVQIGNLLLLEKPMKCLKNRAFLVVTKMQLQS